MICLILGLGIALLTQTILYGILICQLNKNSEELQKELKYLTERMDKCIVRLDQRVNALADYLNVRFDNPGVIVEKRKNK